jgi:hypothetical protein
VSDSNEIFPSKLVTNNIKLEEKFDVVVVHSPHKNATRGAYKLIVG